MIMKRRIIALLCAGCLFSLTACGNGNPQPDASKPPSQPVEESEPPADTTKPTDTPGATDAPEEGGKTLVAYFSWSGNTEQVAQIIQAATGADVFKIEPATPYTDDYNALLDVARQEQADNARPELAAQVENWENYDVIFVGYPNWWSDVPMAVYTFLESYDFKDKTLVPFNTSASGGFGRSLDGIAESAAGATILEGIALTEGELADAQNAVTEWLAALEVN